MAYPPWDPTTRPLYAPNVLMAYPTPLGPPMEVLAAYHWADFGRQNALVAALAASRHLAFLNVHTQTALRPGGHMPARKSAAGDCAHYCIPGPLDTWVRLLLALWT